MSNTTQPKRRSARGNTGGPHVKFTNSAPADSGRPHGKSCDARVILQTKALKKSFHKGKNEIRVLREVDIQVHQGQLTAIVGQSGCGKSTLLHLLATLDQPDHGEVHFDGRRIDNLPSRQRDTIRNRDIGIIFQFYHLLPEFTALENVLMPTLIDQGVFSYWRTRARAKKRAIELLAMVGLEDRLRHRPSELSGGEMQRAAIARALMAQPKLLLADEPTGNLDRKNGDDVMAILRRLNQQDDLTIVMVTHDQTMAASADRTVQLVEGRVQNSSPGHG